MIKAKEWIINYTPELNKKALFIILMPKAILNL